LGSFIQRESLCKDDKQNFWKKNEDDEHASDADVAIENLG
jgi:hypothetical protein